MRTISKSFSLAGPYKQSDKLTIPLFALLAVCFFGLSVQAKYGGGTGELNNPYLIYTAEQINAIGADVNDWDKHFKLMADIDLSGYPGTDFNIIGYWGDWADYKTFTGVFDGNGHTISNFSYTSSDTDCTGLFGRVRGENAEVRDLGLIDPNIDVGIADFVGSLVGHNWGGTISSCYVEGGSVWGDSDVGGLVGLSDGTIVNCYATSTVSGNESIGGLVGGNRGTITNCYATGGVSGNEDVGELVGRNDERVTSSFWDIQSSGQSISAGGEGKTTAEMQTASTFLEVGWDFVNETENGTEDIWWILEGQDYPKLVSKLSGFSLHPQDGAIDVFQPLILSWVPGGSALHHDVYFGGDEEAVKNADTISPEYKGSGNLGSESYDPGQLEWNTTYYWRIDEVNDTNPDSPWTGNVWSFTTANFLIVDDFEDYDAGENQIWFTWHDGLGYGTPGTEPYSPGNGTGSAVGDENTPSHTEETIVHGGNQTMPVFYDNSVLMYSEVEKTLTYPRDWTENGVDTLTIWFRGNSVNVAETLYVALNGSAVVSHDNLDAAQIDEWTRWNIDLQAFADQGVDLTNVNTISLGLGDKNNPQPGGAGTMYFDDVRLYGTEDWPHYLGPNFDLQSPLKEFTAESGIKVWDVKVETGMCSVTVADGLLYTMGNNETNDFVYCFNAKTGKEKWTFDYPCRLEPRLHPGGPSSTPTIHEGKVYTLSKFGHIFCLEAKSGEKLWEASADQYRPTQSWWGFAGSPTVVGDVVIYNIGDRGLALNKDTGQLVWKSEQNVVAYATPKPLPAGIFNRSVVALFTNRDFLVLDPATGQSVATYTKTWQEKSNCNAITPYIHKDRIYLVHSAHGMSCLSLDGDKLKQDWLSEDAKYPNQWYSFNTHVIYEDNIYFLTKDRTGLNCVDAMTGQRKWFDEKYDFGNLLRVGDKMIMLSEKGELIWGELGEAAFREIHRQKILDGLCWAKPVLLGDLLYARNAEGTVVCLKLE